MTKSGHWTSAIQGDTGFPDLCMVHKLQGRVIFAELKTNEGKLTWEQDEWGYILSKCPGVEYYIWRPSDDVEGILKGRNDKQRFNEQ